MRPRATIRLVLLGTVACLSGCFPTVYVPKLQFEHIAVRPHFAQPVYTGPGSIGPIWSTPRVTLPGQCCDPCGDPCGSCCGPSSPLQPIDPFGWLRVGSKGSHEVDPVGWVFGL